MVRLFVDETNHPNAKGNPMIWTFKTWCDAFMVFYTDLHVPTLTTLQRWFDAGKTPEWAASHARHLDANRNDN